MTPMSEVRSAMIWTPPSPPAARSVLSVSGVDESVL